MMESAIRNPALRSTLRRAKQSPQSAIAKTGKWWRKLFGLKGVDVKLSRTSDIGPRMYVASILPLWSDDHFDGMAAAAEAACRIAIEQYEAYQRAI